MALVEYEKKNNHLTIITLNRPDKLNAFKLEMFNEIREAWICYCDDASA